MTCTDMSVCKRLWHMCRERFLAKRALLLKRSKSSDHEQKRKGTKNYVPLDVPGTVMIVDDTNLHHKRLLMKNLISQYILGCFIARDKNSIAVAFRAEERSADARLNSWPSSAAFRPTLPGACPAVSYPNAEYRRYATLTQPDRSDPSGGQSIQKVDHVPQYAESRPVSLLCHFRRSQVVSAIGARV